MSHSKKSRKGTDSTPKFAPRVKKSERTQVSRKKDNGNKAGSRHNEALTGNRKGAGAEAKQKDNRLGSKKPVALDLPNQRTNTEPKQTKAKLTDEQKLLQLEENPRLNKLLDMLEEGRELEQDDQNWLNKQLSSIEKLMDKLGLTDAETMEKQPPRHASDDDLLAQFESGADRLKDYQN